MTPARLAPVHSVRDPKQLCQRDTQGAQFPCEVLVRGGARRSGDSRVSCFAYRDRSLKLLLGLLLVSSEMTVGQLAEAVMSELYVLQWLMISGHLSCSCFCKLWSVVFAQTI